MFSNLNFSNIKSKITSTISKKQLSCPHCGQKLSVPVKMGKTLRITCSRCSTQFDISFKMPSFNKNTFDQLKTSLNSSSFYSRYKFIIWVVVGFILINILSKLFLPSQLKSKPASPNTPVIEQKENKSNNS